VTTPELSCVRLKSDAEAAISTDREIRHDAAARGQEKDDMAIVQTLDKISNGRRVLAIKSPVTLEDLGEFEVATKADVQAAVARARAAQPAWAALGAKERAGFMWKLRDQFVDRADEIVDVICKETGKTAQEALMMEAFAPCDAITYWAKHAKKILADRRQGMHLLGPMKKMKFVYRPLGVVGIITPWNGPMALATNPVVQALLAGNAVLLKPSEIAPLSGQLLGNMMETIGLPENVFQVLHGDGETGGALLEAGVDKISFTGSVATGRKVGEICGRNLTPCTLELGGKDPAIICSDANLERAARGTVFGAYFNTGQVCMSLERVYVMDDVADEFIAKCVEHTKSLRVGDPKTCDVGAIFMERQLEIIESHVEDARAKGATIHTGGKRAEGLKGLFYEPTVISDLTPDMKVLTDETFGPVLPIVRVQSEEEAIELANKSDYGLTASVWTKDKVRGEALARRIDAGSVAINDHSITYGVLEAPFGGVKNSGVGRVNGKEALRSYCYEQPIISDRWGRDTESQWYPFLPADFDGMKKAMKVLYKTPIGRWMA
jgi:acyl-CoA reductase-like NAD-dependent aldehyde dehydrogenase